MVVTIAILQLTAVGTVEPLVGLLDVGPDVGVGLAVVVATDCVAELKLRVGHLEGRKERASEKLFGLNSTVVGSGLVDTILYVFLSVHLPTKTRGVALKEQCWQKYIYFTYKK